MHRFDRRVAVITGAGSGIGRATSLLLATKGCDLALVDIDDTGMAETAAAVRASGRKVSIHQVDVSSRAQMQVLPEQVLGEHGGVHIVVNNAGVGLTGTVEDTAIEDFDWIVGINFWGVLYGCKFFLPLLQREDEAHIVNISSMLAFVGLPAQSGYCATKSAVRALTEALFVELAGTGVGVTSVHPGSIRTNIVRASRFYDDAQKRQIAQRLDRFAIAPERVARRIVRAIEHNTLRVVVGPDAHLVVWLTRLLPVLPLRAAAWAYRRYASSGG